MDRAKPAHSACAIVASSAIATALGPFLVPVMRQIATGEIWLGDLARLFGDLDMMFMWLNMLSNALVIVFGLVAGVGVLLAAFRVKHVIFYSATGAIVAVIVQALFGASMYGSVGAALRHGSVPYALTGLACGAIYWLTMRFFSAFHRKAPV